MLNQCFNADCRKPLHYLREGRVVVFGVKESGEDGESRLEHYWLCGPCAQKFVLVREDGDVHLLRRKAKPRRAELEMPGQQALAS